MSICEVLFQSGFFHKSEFLVQHSKVVLARYFLTNNVVWTSLTLFVVSFLGGIAHAQDEDLFNYENSLKYASHLYSIQRFQVAAKEYERVLYFVPKNIEVQQKLLSSYFRAREFDYGIQRALWMYPVTDSMPAKVAFCYGKLLMLGKSYDHLEGLLRKNQQMSGEHMHVLQLGHALFIHNWEHAQNIYHQFSEEENLIKQYQPIITKTLQLKTKKPPIALALSTVLPGLGRFYTKQWKDGLVSLGIIGSLGFAAYRNFRRNGNQSVLGWVYGGLATGFYLGNLYGSWQSAHRFNDHQSEEILDETERLIYSRF